MLSFSTAVGISAFALCTVAGAPAALAAPQSQSVADEVVSLTNNERAKAGCAPLKAESHLTQAAQGHSEDMAAGGFMDHNSSKGDPGDRISAAGYHAQTWAENIAAGQRSASEVLNSWMNSAGHRANILNCGLKDIGVGYAKAGNGTAYWTQDFGTSNRQGDEKPAEPGKPGKPTDGGDKPGKPGDGGDKPGKPGDGGDKPGKPGGGDNKPWDPWNPWGDGSDDNGGDPWGDGNPDNGDNSPWDPWGDGGNNGGDSGDPWGGWNPWGNGDAKPGNGDTAWDPWSNGFDKPSSNGGDSPWGAWGQEFDDLLGQLAGKGGW
ncbi:CAP domain-containing protein [Nocardia sp. NPDC046473]|uniref:CAP domain-containing protein n=1 Tax=Nocardia sp. NPDC046473 TaxID=3155733 RepID=UPI0033DE7B2E